MTKYIPFILVVTHKFRRSNFGNSLFLCHLRTYMYVCYSFHNLLLSYPAAKKREKLALFSSNNFILQRIS